MRNKKTIKEFRAFYIMASSVYAKSSRKRKSGVIVQFNKKHGRPSSEHPVETVRTYNAAGELIRTEEVTFDNSKELSRNSHGNCENNTGKRRMRSVWNMATTASGGVTHYAKFPNELAERCILCGTAEGDVVLDPFVGSGTSCRVANRYGRQYIGD